MSDKKNAKDDLVLKILREAKNEGANSVGLYATGEPFKQEFRKLYKICKKNWI